MSCVSLNPTEKHCDGILDLGFIIDSSGSIGKSSWREVKRFLLSLARRLTVSPGRTHIGALTFDTGARMEFDFNDGHEINAVEEKFETMREPSGFTYTDEALKLANEQLFSYQHGMRPNASKVGVSFTYIRTRTRTRTRAHTHTYTHTHTHTHTHTQTDIQSCQFIVL